MRDKSPTCHASDETPQRQMNLLEVARELGRVHAQLYAEIFKDAAVAFLGAVSLLARSSKIGYNLAFNITLEKPLNEYP